VTAPAAAAATVTTKAATVIRARFQAPPLRRTRTTAASTIRTRIDAAPSARKITATVALPSTKGRQRIITTETEEADRVCAARCWRRSSLYSTLRSVANRAADASLSCGCSLPFGFSAIRASLSPSPLPLKREPLFLSLHIRFMVAVVIIWCVSIYMCVSMTLLYFICPCCCSVASCHSCSSCRQRVSYYGFFFFFFIGCFVLRAVFFLSFAVLLLFVSYFHEDGRRGAPHTLCIFRCIRVCAHNRVCLCVSHEWTAGRGKLQT
jgi:hypothetical protein